MTSTTKDRKRGHVVRYADPPVVRGPVECFVYPAGMDWKIPHRTLSNITRMKTGESIVTGKILVTFTVTIIGLWSHSGTGEEWADDSNAMTAAEAQTFRRACS